MYYGTKHEFIAVVTTEGAREGESAVLTKVLILRPPPGAWSRWSETFIDYVNLLAIVNNSTLTEVLNFKLLRLLLSENEQSSFDPRRLNVAALPDDALKQLKHHLGH